MKKKIFISGLIALAITAITFTSSLSSTSSARINSLTELKLSIESASAESGSLTCNCSINDYCRLCSRRGREV